MNSRPLPQRKSPRLQGYDYAQGGAYFVTICAFQGEHLFGDVHADQMCLSDVGRIVHEHWHDLAKHHPHIDLDAFVIMPNHVHGIVVIAEAAPASSVVERVASARPNGPTSGSLGAIIGSYKSAVQRHVNCVMGMTAPRVWQARYHDHIIRHERALHQIRWYIEHNPEQWDQDTFFKQPDRS